MLFFFDDANNEPYNPADVRIESKSFPVFQVMHWIDNDELELQPAYQRNIVWNRKAKSLLIESMILNIPIPAFYFDEDVHGIKSIIDGLQRISAIYDFISNKYSLYGLQYLKECEKKCFTDLSANYRHRIEDTQLTINILDSSCPQLVKYDVFHRINTQGFRLNKQEIRNIMMSQSTRNLLVRMAGSELFAEVTHHKISDRRMDAQELCLRYIACYKWIDADSLVYKKFSDLADVVDLTVDILNHAEDSEKKELFLLFEESMKNCQKIFGDNAFMKQARQKKRAFNKALFVSFSVLLSVRQYDVEKANFSEMYRLLDDFIESNADYKASLTSTTSSYKHVQAQVLFANDFLRENL